MMFPYLLTALTNLFKKPSCKPFPDPEDMGMAGYRGRISFDADKCVDCGLCIKVCAPMAITRQTEETEEELRITRSFDMTSCTFCAFCQDFCGTKAIKLTADYHMTAENPAELATSGVTVKKKAAANEGVIFSDSCVYCTLCAKKCPVGAITVDRENKTWSIDRSACIKCGQCINNCPKKALSMGAVEE